MFWRRWSLWSGQNKYRTVVNGRILSRSPRVYRSCSAIEEEITFLLCEVWQFLFLSRLKTQLTLGLQNLTLPVPWYQSPNSEPPPSAFPPSQPIFDLILSVSFFVFLRDFSVTLPLQNLHLLPVPPHISPPALLVTCPVRFSLPEFTVAAVGYRLTCGSFEILSLLCTENIHQSLTLCPIDPKIPSALFWQALVV